MPTVPRQVQRQLPQSAGSIMQTAPVPYLDANCRFPWYGVKGCKGKDTRAMLKLTVSDDLVHRQKVDAGRGWYDSVRQGYGSK